MTACTHVQSPSAPRACSSISSSLCGHASSSVVVVVVVVVHHCHTADAMLYTYVVHSWHNKMLLSSVEESESCPAAQCKAGQGGRLLQPFDIRQMNVLSVTGCKLGKLAILCSLSVMAVGATTCSCESRRHVDDNARFCCRPYDIHCRATQPCTGVRMWRLQGCCCLAGLI